MNPSRLRNAFLLWRSLLSFFLGGMLRTKGSLHSCQTPPWVWVPFRLTNEQFGEPRKRAANPRGGCGRFMRPLIITPELAMLGVFVLCAAEALDRLTLYGPHRSGSSERLIKNFNGVLGRCRTGYCYGWKCKHRDDDLPRARLNKIRS